MAPFFRSTLSYFRSGGDALFKGCHGPRTVLTFIPMGASIILILALQAVGPAVQLPTGEVLRVSGAVSQSLALSLQDLATMPRSKVTAKEHDTNTLADTADGKPLPERQGPLRIVVPQEKKGARWIRMVESIEVVTLP
jgi:DMSO/TMAO reductase YedYZ molybdopterin-dependent catalytic subunit